MCDDDLRQARFAPCGLLDGPATQGDHSSTAPWSAS